MQLENLNLENLNLNYWAIAPEIITSLTGVLLMLVDALQKKGERKLKAAVALIGLVLALLSVFRLSAGGSYFGGMVVTDPIRVFFSVTILIVRSSPRCWLRSLCATRDCRRANSSRCSYSGRRGC